MNRMFYHCENLTNIDLFSFDTKNVNNMSDMFSGCSNLKSVKINNINLNNKLSNKLNELKINII